MTSGISASWRASAARPLSLLRSLPVTAEELIRPRRGSAYATLQTPFKRPASALDDGPGFLTLKPIPSQYQRSFVGSAVAVTALPKLSMHLRVPVDYVRWTIRRQQPGWGAPGFVETYVLACSWAQRF
ncbi:MAG: hypothetical protein HY078_15280 [Elusimicrobia bacterium]|nr:hypothetical protein [Elusimicrobiota bacterium]